MLLCLVWGVQVLRRPLMKRIQGAEASEQMREEVSKRQVEKIAGWTESTTTYGKLCLMGLLPACLTVVILRSYIGMAVSFSWKTTLFAGTIAVLAVVLGKVAGGFVAASIGIRRTVVVSLGLASICYLLSDYMIAGVAALFLFNMTMPITLYLLVQRLRRLPGFAFGALTFGLFLGFLPAYFGVKLPMSGCIIGCVGSLVSLLLLWLCVRPTDRAVLQSIEKEIQEVG